METSVSMRAVLVLGSTHLQQAEYRIRPLYEQAVRGVLQVTQTPTFVGNHDRTFHRARVTSSKEVPDVDRRALERVLKSEGIDREHCIVEVELARQL